VQAGASLLPVPATLIRKAKQMRVVERKAFLALPPGTIYCKGVKWAFEALCIKGETFRNDWYYLNPAWPYAGDSGAALNLLDDGFINGTSFSCETAETRDALLEADAVFLIFEDADLVFLRGMIDRAIRAGTSGIQ
jgi:hypothetical protein